MEPHKPPSPARLTVVSTTYHQLVGGAPLSVLSKFTRPLQTTEQVYQRKSTIGTDWQPIDPGWIGSNPSMLIIQNTEGQQPTVIPSKKELEELSDRMIELTDQPDSATAIRWQVPPGESLRACLSSIDGLYMRCRKGTASHTLTLFPG